MTRKRFTKLLMADGHSRDQARKAADRVVYWGNKFDRTNHMLKWTASFMRVDRSSYADIMKLFIGGDEPNAVSGSSEADRV